MNTAMLLEHAISQMLLVFMFDNSPSFESMLPHPVQSTVNLLQGYKLSRWVVVWLGDGEQLH